MNRIEWFRLSCSICLMCWVHFARAQDVFDDVIVNNSTQLNGTTTINGSVSFEALTGIFRSGIGLTITNGSSFDPVNFNVTGDIIFGPESAIASGDLLFTSSPTLSQSQLKIRSLVGRVKVSPGFAMAPMLSLEGRTQTVFDGNTTFNSMPIFDRVFFSPNGPISWGNTGAMLSTDQGASIELRGDGVPYIDFSNDSNNPNADFDMRLILANDDVLGIDGGTFALVESGALGSSPSDFDSHKLFVGGSAFGENITVPGTITATLVRGPQIQTVVEENFPDFVFEEDYDLATLKEVKAHIQEHGHLKDIPSAEKVKENGLELTVFQQQLLRKVEELTLYVISKQQKINELKQNYQQKILPLQREIKKLRNTVN